MDLFDSAQNTISGPLAARMRPRNLDEYIGQDHIVGTGRLLRRAIAADQLTSVIFYGPPGTGKTTLARVIANHTKSIFVTLNAVLTGVQNIRQAINDADEQRKLYNRRTILFVDEVHRWNKNQQDALLPWVENGTIILVGATTENPFFEVNKALVSRSRVFQLKTLTRDDLFKAAKTALCDTERGYGKWHVEFEEGALEHLVDTANGDARSLLNALELAVQTTPDTWEPPEGTTVYISCETAEQSIQKKVVLYDRDGDYHYDIISAFIKSIRGSDPDATMYWMAKMLRAGEDPHFIFRRMLISACEDIGLADPNAIRITESCAAAFDRIGLPEGRFMLTQAALYLATCPKSNSTLCFFDALKAVEEEEAHVPNHLRDSSRDSEGFGHGKGYMYPHAYKDHWVAQQYLPDTLNGRVFYNPGNMGYEKTIQQEVLSRRELYIAEMLQSENPHATEINLYNNPQPITSMSITAPQENLTFSPGDNKRTSIQQTWQQRTESNRTDFLLSVRNATVEHANILRHHRNLIMQADDGLLLWDIWRKSPEGVTAGICRNKENMHILMQYASTLETTDRPILTLNTESLCDIVFDRIFYKNPVTTKESIQNLVQELIAMQTYFAPQASIIISQNIPNKAQRLAHILTNNQTPYTHIPIPHNLLSAEEAFYTDNTNPLFNWTDSDITHAIQTALPTAHIENTDIIYTEKRHIPPQTIAKWFDTAQSPYATFMHTQLNDTHFKTLQTLFETAAQKPLPWKTHTTVYTVTLA